MKKIYALLVGLLLCLSSYSQTSPGFSITNTSGTNFITCSNSSVNYVATSTANLTYLWVSSNATLSGASVSITIPGSYSVIATDTLNNNSVQMLSVQINTFLPMSTVSPSTQYITCSSPSAQFVIVVSPSPTITGFPSASQTQSISSQYGAAYVLNSNASFIYQVSAPGTYTYLQVDNNNGCSVVKQFTVTSATGFPTFSLTSPQNFTLGCNTKSVAVVNIINAQTTPTLGGVVSYSLIGGFGALSSYSITSPGLYTVAVKDDATNCISKALFSILQNTTAPTLSVNVPQQILDCNTTQVTLKASSSTPNIYYDWMFPGTPSGANAFDTFVVHINTSAPNSSLISTFTAVVTDNSSTCKSMSVIPMYQNTFKPNAAISSGGVYSITCITTSIVLTNISSTGIPLSTGFLTNQPVIGAMWSGPSPLIPAVNSSTYLATLAGTYTLEAKDLNNGCKSTATIGIVGDCNKVGIEYNSANNFKFSVFPNPSTGSFTLLSTNSNETKKIDIYNTLGVLIKSENISSEKTNLHMEDVSRGIYIIQVYENNKLVYSSKILKQ